MDLSLEELKGIGPKRREALENAGIHTARDLVCYLPREYRDLTDVRPLALLRTCEGAAVRVRVIGGVSMTRFRGLVIVRARLEVASGKMQEVWYNQSLLKEQLAPGRELL
ncbi:MAG: DNA helicase RecG, partial [Eubacteriales bacterium]|nr:DNA helicase RecG [Eubacteriales bacterium]